MKTKVISATRFEIELVKSAANDIGREEAAEIFGIELTAFSKRMDRLREKHGFRTVAALVALFFRNKLIK